MRSSGAVLLLLLPAAGAAAGPGGVIDWGQDPVAQLRTMLPLRFAPRPSPPAQILSIDIPEADVQRIGRRIWVNKCGGTIAGLTSWNDGEAFASLGIGHFIWYPAGQDGPFEESFPKLLAFLAANGAALPDWLAGAPDCPWPDRAAFRRDLDSQRMRELRGLLSSTIALQARFIVDRLEAALPKILATLPAPEREPVSRQFYHVAGESLGVYGLVDYVNFKGEGIFPTERYKGEGWGLLQVLQGMTGAALGQPALDKFTLSADQVLTRRVKNSPPERHEERWLPGWKARVLTYSTGPLFL